MNQKMIAVVGYGDGFLSDLLREVNMLLSNKAPTAYGLEDYERIERIVQFQVLPRERVDDDYVAVVLVEIKDTKTEIDEEQDAAWALIEFAKGL